jgi:hypothetical protein
MRYIHLDLLLCEGANIFIAKNICDEQMQKHYRVVNANCQTMVNLLKDFTVVAGPFTPNKTLSHAIGHGPGMSLFDVSEFANVRPVKMKLTKTQIEPNWQDGRALENARNKRSFRTGDMNQFIDFSQARYSILEQNELDVRSNARFWAQPHDEEEDGALGEENRALGEESGALGEENGALGEASTWTGPWRGSQHSLISIPDNANQPDPRLVDPEFVESIRATLRPEQVAAADALKGKFEEHYESLVSRVRDCSMRSQALAPYRASTVPAEKRIAKEKKLKILNGRLLRQHRAARQTEVKSTTERVHQLIVRRLSEPDHRRSSSSASSTDIQE